MTWELAPGQAWALSLHQPWAWLVVCGAKGLENRPWNTTFRGRVLIHAGVNAEAAVYDQACRWRDVHAPSVLMPAPSALDRGGIIGSVEIVDVIRRCLPVSVTPTPTNCRCGTPWHVGSQSGFVLRGAKRCDFHQVRGLQKFFRVPSVVPA